MIPQASYIYDRLLAGREGVIEVDRVTIDTMSIEDSNAITAKIDYEQTVRPCLVVKVRDTPSGGLVFKWKEGS